MLGNAVEEGSLATTMPITLEILRSARDARDARTTARELSALPRIPVTDRVGNGAPGAFSSRWRGGATTVRPPPTGPLVAAAAAESVEAELWHCDRHFELIAEVTGQPQRGLGE